MSRKDKKLRIGKDKAVANSHCSWTGLHDAAWVGSVNVGNLLIEKGAPINATDCFGRTPLHVALMKNHDTFIMFMLQRGASVNLADCEGDTPLHTFAKYHEQGVSEDMVYQLLRAGSDVDAFNKKGWTALHVLASCRSTDEFFAGMLLEDGATVDEKTRDGKNFTPLRLNMEGNRQITSLLHEFGADVRNMLTSSEISAMHPGDTYYDVAIDMAFSPRLLRKNVDFEDGVYETYSWLLTELGKEWALRTRSIENFENRMQVRHKQVLDLLKDRYDDRKIEREIIDDGLLFVEKLMREKVPNTNTGVTLYKMMVMAKSSLADFISRSPAVAEFIESVLNEGLTFLKDVYRHDCRKQIEHHLRKAKALIDDGVLADFSNGVKKYFASQDKNPLPHEVVLMIMAYLERDDMVNFPEAVTPSMRNNYSNQKCSPSRGVTTMCRWCRARSKMPARGRQNGLRQ